MAGKWRKKLKWRGGVFWGIPEKSLKQGYRGGIGAVYGSRPPLSGYYPGPLLKPPSGYPPRPPRPPILGLLPGTPTKAPIWVPPILGLLPGSPIKAPIWGTPYTHTPYHWQTPYTTCSPHLFSSKKAGISIFHSIIRKLKCNKM